MTLTVQFYTIVSMILMGIWLGVAVDTYGRFIHPNRWSVFLFISDILFWLVQGLLIFFVLLIVNEGNIRFYIFLALLCGFAMYRALFQTLYNHLLTVSIRFSVKIFHVCKKMFQLFMFIPIKTLVRCIFRIGSFLYNLITKFCVFIIRIIVSILKWFARLVWSFFPKTLQIHIKRLAGLWKIMQNKIKKWFE